MKGECEKCGKIAELELEPADGGTRVRCSACAATYIVLAAKPKSPPPEAGKRCPKCSAPEVPGAPACPRCGLLAEKWESFQPAIPEADAQTVALWSAVEESWSDPARHDAFLGNVQRVAAFAYAAARYRGRSGDATADERLRQVLVMAQHALLATGAPAGKRAGRHPIALILLVAFLLALFAGGWLLLRYMTAAPR